MENESCTQNDVAESYGRYNEKQILIDAEHAGSKQSKGKTASSSLNNV